MWTSRRRAADLVAVTSVGHVAAQCTLWAIFILTQFRTDAHVASLSVLGPKWASLTAIFRPAIAMFRNWTA